MIGHRVKYSHALASTYRATLVPQVIQAITPVFYSGGDNYKGTLEVDDLCKHPFFSHLYNISICDILSVQSKADNPE